MFYDMQYFFVIYSFNSAFYYQFFHDYTACFFVESSPLNLTLPSLVKLIIIYVLSLLNIDAFLIILWADRLQYDSSI